MEKVIEVFGNKMHVDPELDGVSQALNEKGVFEEDTTRLLRRIIKNGMTVVDVGAHIGYYTLIFASEVKGEGIVFSFEPDPQNFEILSTNVEENEFENVTLKQVVILDYDGETMLYPDLSNSAN